MRLLVVGGKLQGTEAAYLAGKAGWEVVLVDRREAPPAAGLAARQVVADVTADDGLARSLVTSCDAVLPACEDFLTLEWLAAHVPVWEVPLLFDLDAYRVTRSKEASRELFARLGVPLPAPWPACGFPAVVKPDSASGSEGVAVVHDEADLERAVAGLRAGGHDPLVEEYVAGPSLSVEVLAAGGRAVALQVTGLEFDDAFDCKRVVAPVCEVAAGRALPPVRPDGGTDWASAVAPGTLAASAAAATRLAEGLGLAGLMDVEYMVRGSESFVLEIDARLPSQTPTAVYWSSGLNIVELLCDTVLRGAPPAVRPGPRRACVYQHVRVAGGRAEVCGEHVMGGAAPLRLVPGLFGADEALTDYQPGAASWSATLIVTAGAPQDARAAADAVVLDIARYERLDVVPENGGGGPAEEART